MTPFRIDRGEPDWSKGLVRARRPGFRRWILGSILVMIALICWLDTATGPGREPTALYDIPIIAAAAVAGLTGGIITTLLCAAAYTMTLIHHHEPILLADLIQMLLFGLVGILFARLASEYMRARTLQASLRDWNAQLERRVAEAVESERAAQKNLQEAERLSALGRAAAQIAHEINNPLVAIGGFARRIEAQIPADHPAQQGVAVIRDEVARLETLLRDLLEFSGPGLGHESRVDLPAVVEQVSVLVGEAARGSGVRVRTSVGARPPSVAGDAEQLKRALLNAALNAVQAMPEGGDLTILVEPQERDGRPWARLLIQDSGRGIPAELRERVFDPFFTTRRGGTGLGLPLIRKTVEAHGGSVELDCPPQGGTTLAIWLPGATHIG